MIVQGYNIPTLSGQISTLSSFTVYSQASYTKLSSFSYLKISLGNASSSQSKPSIVISSGLYAGYLSNIDFVFNLTSTILQGLNTSNALITNLLTSADLYIIPILNEAAYAKMQSDWISTGVVNVYETDQSISNNCTTNDTGINPNHNFNYNWTSAESYGISCSADYSGSSSMSSSLTKDIDYFFLKFKPQGLLNYNYAGNLYFQPYSCDNTSSSTLNSFQTYVYGNLSALLPTQFKAGNQYTLTKNTSCGSFLDYSTYSGIISFEIGVTDSINDHENFVYNFLGIFNNILTAAYISSVFSVNAYNISANETMSTEIIGIIINITNKGLQNLDSFNVSLTCTTSNAANYTYMNASVTESYPYNTTTNQFVIIPSGNSSTSTFGLVFPYHISPLAISSFQVFIQRSADIGNSLDSYITLAPTSVNFTTVTTKFTLSDSNSAPSSSSSSSSSTSKTEIIAASFVLVAINGIVIIVGFIWKCRKELKGDDRSPSFSKKEEANI